MLVRELGQAYGASREPTRQVPVPSHRGGFLLGRGDGTPSVRDQHSFVEAKWLCFAAAELKGFG